MSIRRVLRWTGLLFGAVMLLALFAAIALWWSLRASLAQLNGHRAIPGLQAKVLIERDHLGVPTIYATNRIDATRALGFLHAQERFFQMDLSRRAGAGELCELVGASALTRDRQQRVHRPRARAKQALQQASPNDLALLQAYADGINAGLDALAVRPPEYLMLRAAPARWQIEDSYLVTYAIFAELHEIEGYDDYHEQVLRAAFSPSALEFFESPDISWSAALDGSTPAAHPIPSPADFSVTNRSPQVSAARAAEPARRWLRSSTPEGAAFHGCDLASSDFGFRASFGLRPSGFGFLATRPCSAETSRNCSDPANGIEEPSQEEQAGSNNWAVDGRRSGTGAAIVANDMHLGLAVPNTWYRARLIYHDQELGMQDIVGVTMPGTPAVIAGSNRYLAWALTASCLDTTDLVSLEIDPANPQRYRTPSGWQEFQHFPETIHVKGGRNVELAVAETIWGPVVTRGKTQFALACTLHDAQAINLRSIEMERLRDTDTALRVSGLAGTPVLNLIIGDRAGNIGYSVLGRLPNRVGFDGSTPTSWADGTRGWKGWVPAEDYPRVLNPTNGILWTANNRTLGSPDYNRLHVAAADNGARAGQIRDDLLALDKPTEQTLWSIYRDDRALYLDRWQELMLSVLTKGAPGKPAWQEAKSLVASWGGRAAVDSQGYRLVRGFRALVLNLLFEPVNQRLSQYDKAMRLSNEDAAWALISARPLHLLNAAYPRYDDLFNKAVELLMADLKGRGIPLSQATWGARNHLDIRHPLTQEVPQLRKWLGHWLDMPDAQVSGDSQMPKVHAGGFGVSERMIVSPGHEENGLYNMPCGQSGHFLSPFYRSEMEPWLRVDPQPLLPGPKVHELELRPGGSA